MKTLIELKNISKSYDDTEILKDFNLSIKDGEFMTLVGPSGCGKTTLLRLIGGFEACNSGEIIFDGKNISDIPANEREVNTVFQSYALFPHLDVFGNVAFGLKNKRIPTENGKTRKFTADEIEEKVKKALKMVKLEGYENRWIDRMSGGQRQRIAIARAIVNEPRVLLLDEPLSALDLKLRQEMQYELKEMQKQLGITFVFVTHDQEEALTMSDTIVVMNHGEIQQIGSSVDIYNEPQNRFVANFIGESNIIHGIYKGNKVVNFFGHDFECVDVNFTEGEECDVVIRPEDFDVHVDPENGKIKAYVSASMFKGVHNELCVIIGEKEYLVHTYENIKVGQTIGLSVDPYEIHIMKLQADVEDYKPLELDLAYDEDEDNE